MNRFRVSIAVLLNVSREIYVVTVS